MSVVDPLPNAVPLPTPPSLEAAADFESLVRDARTTRIANGWQLVLDIHNSVITDITTAKAQADILVANYNTQITSAVSALASDSTFDFMRWE